MTPAMALAAMTPETPNLKTLAARVDAIVDRLAKERLQIGLHTDGTPSMWVEGREIQLGKE